MPSFQEVLKAAEIAFKKLFEKGKYNPKDLLKTKEWKGLINATAKSIGTAIPHDVPTELKSYLDKDVFIFSALKTHTQLTQARSFLKDDKGEMVPYHLFEQKILKLNQTYNKNYLEAEYLFAQQSSQSAANWANLQEDTSRYYLQYRTAGDDRVRDSHDKLRNTTLPKDDAFWDSYYPPMGWRCRCTAVEVLAKDYDKSDPEKASKLADIATTQIGKNGENKLEMFRYNPGKEKVVFPPKNAYTKIVGAEVVKKEVEQREKERKEIWETIETKKGKLRVSSFHGKNEKKENIEIGSYFSNKYGHIIDLIGRSDTEKKADSYNHTLGHTQEYKRNNKATKSAIDNEIRSAAKQSNHIVLDIQSEISDGDLRNSIQDRIKRCKKLIDINIIRNGNDTTYLAKDIIKDTWEL